MPSYYFDIRDFNGFHRDEFGDEFENVREARDHARSMLSEITREKLPLGDVHNVSCDVRDETGRFVYRGEITYREEQEEL